MSKKLHSEYYNFTIGGYTPVAQTKSAFTGDITTFRTELKLHGSKPEC